MSARARASAKAARNQAIVQEYQQEQKLATGVQLVLNDDNELVRSIVRHSIRDSPYNTPLKIQHIFKVSNPNLRPIVFLRSYAKNQSSVQLHNNGQVKWLWHGSSKANLFSIINNGFDLSKASAGCDWGKKIYLSPTPNYSVIYSCRFDLNHTGVLLCLAHVEKDNSHYGPALHSPNIPYMQYGVDRVNSVLPQYLVVFDYAEAAGYYNPQKQLHFKTADGATITFKTHIQDQLTEILPAVCKWAGIHPKHIRFCYNGVRVRSFDTMQKRLLAGLKMEDGAVVSVVDVSWEDYGESECTEMNIMMHQ